MQGLIDIHCHIIPGVDDGAHTIHEAALMLKSEYQNGVEAIILTPHYRSGMFETSQEQVEKQFHKVWKLTRRSRSGMRVYLGCEYHTNRNMVADLNAEKRPTMAGSRYVLTEFSSMHGYETIRNQVYELIAAGYKPIVAHAERYPCLLKQPDLVRELIDLGAKLQITAGSILGHDGWRIKRFCWKLLKKKQVDYIASDMHDLEERGCRLKECAEILEKKFGSQYVEQIMRRNPRKIILEGRKNT